MRELGHLAEETARFWRAHLLDDEAAFELNLVLEELFVNAVRHGGCEGMENAVEIRLQLEEPNVVVGFSDRGRPFNPISAPVPDLAAPLADRQDGGLGIHFVRQIMRDVDYRREGEWNRLTMRMNLIKESI